MLVHPPFRFAIVEAQLYRGAYPKERNYSFLKSLNLKTILSLIPGTPTNSLLSFGAHQSIHHIQIQVDKPKENVPLTFTQVTQILQVLLNKDNLPMYVHCMDGTVVTGIVIACLRKIQFWSNAMALQEYSRFISDDGNHVPDQEETVFVNQYNTEMQIDVDSSPCWLKVIGKHPTLRVNYSTEVKQAELKSAVPHPSLGSLSELDVLESSSDINEQMNNNLQESISSAQSSVASSSIASTLKSEKEQLTLRTLTRRDTFKNDSKESPITETNLSITLQALALESSFKNKKL